MQIKSLGYVGIFAADLDAWRDFAQGVLAAQVETVPTGLALRLDEKVQRLLVHPGERDGGAYFGWEVQDAPALEAARAQLQDKGVAVHASTPEERAVRHVAGMAWFADPLGNRFELFHGLADAQAPFRPPRPMRGFRTDELGIGHAVLTGADIDAVLPFYRDVLGFRMSDYALSPFHAVFLHVNARHHSLALLQTDRSGLHHLMIEVLSLDDLGRGYDAALEREVVSVTLGRHTNDHVLSFYARTPSEFLFEYGWGGRSVDDATWKVEEMRHGPSLWGHERAWLDDAGRAEARRLRESVAADGAHAPVHLAAGEYDEATRG